MCISAVQCRLLQYCSIAVLQLQYCRGQTRNQSFVHFESEAIVLHAVRCSVHVEIYMFNYSNQMEIVKTSQNLMHAPPCMPTESGCGDCSCLPLVLSTAIAREEKHGRAEKSKSTMFKSETKPTRQIKEPRQNDSSHHCHNHSHKQCRPSSTDNGRVRSRDFQRFMHLQRDAAC